MTGQIDAAGTGSGSTSAERCKGLDLPIGADVGDGEGSPGNAAGSRRGGVDGAKAVVEGDPVGQHLAGSGVGRG